jgi:hypothetical protein
LPAPDLRALAVKAEAIRPGAMIGGRKVVRAVNGMATFRVVRSEYAAPARLVTFADGGQAAYEIGTQVAAKGWAEPLPAGGVTSRVVRTPDKVRASRKEWRGEQVHGMSTRDHDLIARTNMFDPGRVNGLVGAARNGVGSVLDTGPSFPPPGE